MQEHVSTLPVLILVVVEDGLVLIMCRTQRNTKKGLNPYCSGRWSRTDVCKSFTYYLWCLNPCCSGRWSRTWQSRDDCWKLCLVLILVVVDEGIVQIVEGSERKEVRVLILVIVEDGLVQTIETLTQYGNAKRS